MKQELTKIDLKDFKNKFTASSMHWEAFNEISRVFKYAQEKYGNCDSWRNFDKDSYRRYLDAYLRHHLNFMSGHEIDAESGLPELLMMTWNLLTLITIKIKTNTQRLMNEVR